MNELKYYKLEVRYDGIANTTKCRYYSLYNSARGIWGSEEHAIAEGEAHKALIIALHVRGKITGLQNLRRLGVEE